uniref:ferric-chelate reductase (NADPH) n=1 Tax=Kwoniella dejecticola CBS 10117 TaxID=1296121 RepID=A0A1A5ZZI8_9TREE|nr:uncharacterized protein I303_06781 [Kwoniella dejecticola CBS 10117]OBR83220.1 hypothetical protein I303_06781 [Kwoniella dejecticola CBS 10117]
MTVTGALTAEVAQGTYAPPFKYVTSYAQDPEVTGSITSALPVNPTVTASSDGAYATAYLQAHMMSWPSYRYAYLLWFVFIALAGIYALAHHLRLSGGSIGLGYKKWGMKRKPIGRKARGGARGMALPSNSALIAIAIFTIVSCVLALIGSDYIIPSSSTLDFSTSFRKRASIGYTISKSFWTSGSRFGFISFALIPLVVLLALKAPPIAIFAWRGFTHLYSDKLALFHRASAWVVWGFTTVHVVLWTIQLFKDQANGRAVWFLIWNSYRFIFGCVAYGAMTAVMVLSLKPFRKNSYEFFYACHVIFVFLTIVCSAIHHPVLWFWMAGALALWGLERAYRFIRLAKINGLFGKKKNRSGNNYDVLAGKPYSDKTQTYGMQELKRSSEYDPIYTDKTLPRPPTHLQENEQDDFGRSTNLGYYDEGSLQPLGSYESRYDESRPEHQRTESTVSMKPIPRSQSGAIPRSSSMASMRMSSPGLPSFVPVPIPIGYAQAQLLPSRTVRLTINVSRPFKWAPGQSVLLYLPEISKFQSHPFTITNNDPNEIVLLVKARKGLTRRLFDLVRAKSLAAVGITDAKDKRISYQSLNPNDSKAALQVPPIFIKSWVDGPMGSSGRVKWTNYTTVLIICGGSGVSFGTAICDYVCRKMNNGIGRTKRVRFCWVVRAFAEIAWIASQLRRCQNLVPKDQLEISIFVTKVYKPLTSSRSAAGLNGGDEFAPPRPGFAGGAHQRRGSADSLASQMSVDSDAEGEGPSREYDETVDSHLSSNYADIIDLTNYEDEEDVNDPAENILSENLQKQGKVRRAKSRKAAKRARPSYAAQGQGQAQGGSPLYPPNRHSQLASSYDHPQPRQSAAYGGGYDDYQPRASISSYDDLQPPRMSGYEDAYGGVHQSNSAQGSNSNLYAPQPHHYIPPHAQQSPTSAPMMLGGTSGSQSQSNYDRRQSYRSLADSTYNQYNPFGGGSGGPGGYSMGPSPRGDDASIAGESVRDLLSRTSRTQSMVLLEDPDYNDQDQYFPQEKDGGLWIDESDYVAMDIMSENSVRGKPKLSAVVNEEVDLQLGNMIVATCGPVTLNTVIRNLVSKHISPSKLRKGDKSGQIDIYTEDYEA